MFKADSHLQQAQAGVPQRGGSYFVYSEEQMHNGGVQGFCYG